MIMNFKASKQRPEDGSEEYRIEIKFQLATTDSIEVNIYWKNILPNRRYCDAFAKKSFENAIINITQSVIGNEENDLSFGLAHYQVVKHINI